MPELIKEPHADILEHTKSDKEKADTLQFNFCSVFTKEPKALLSDNENKHIEHTINAQNQHPWKRNRETTKQTENGTFHSKM